jgi:hypothetical protein
LLATKKTNVFCDVPLLLQKTATYSMDLFYNKVCLEFTVLSLFILIVENKFFRLEKLAVTNGFIETFFIKTYLKKVQIWGFVPIFVSDLEVLLKPDLNFQI